MSPRRKKKKPPAPEPSWKPDPAIQRYIQTRPSDDPVPYDYEELIKRLDDAARAGDRAIAELEARAEGARDAATNISDKTARLHKRILKAYEKDMAEQLRIHLDAGGPKPSAESAYGRLATKFKRHERTISYIITGK